MSTWSQLSELLRKRLELEPNEPLTALMNDPNVTPEDLGSPRPMTTSMPQNASLIANPLDRPVSERLQEAYSQIPKRTDYEPSLLRKILGYTAAGITGAGQGAQVGAEVGSNIINKPYNTAYQDWLRERISPLEKQQTMELERQKVGQAGLSGQASLIRALGATNPELQGNIAGSQAAAKIAVEEPFKRREEIRKQEGAVSLEEARQKNRTELEDLRQQGRLDAEAEKYLNDLEKQEKGITSTEKIAQANRISRERIAQLNRESREKTVGEKYVPTLDEARAQSMSEHEIATMSDPDTIKQIFTKDKAGFWHLKPKVTGEYEEEWLEAKRQIYLFKNRLLTQTREELK